MRRGGRGTATSGRSAGRTPRRSRRPWRRRRRRCAHRQLCLLAADLPSTRGPGPVGAVGIAAAFLAMTTLLPTVLVIFGRWLFWPFVPRYSPDPVELDVAAQHGVWRRIAGSSAGGPARCGWEQRRRSSSRKRHCGRTCSSRSG
ncbi:hypothetical protein DLE60_16315 [Micromonospora globispora]|nr:hypothetical protein DLE60_16315 [Micromonospora globispora]